MHRIFYPPPPFFQNIASKCLCSSLLGFIVLTFNITITITITITIIIVVLTKIRWSDFILWSIFGKDISKLRVYPSSLERRIPSLLLPLWQHLSFFSSQISTISCYFYFVTCRFALISSGIMFCWVDLRTFRVLFFMYIVGLALVFFSVMQPYPGRNITGQD